MEALLRDHIDRGEEVVVEGLLLRDRSTHMLERILRGQEPACSDFDACRVEAEPIRHNGLVKNCRCDDHSFGHGRAFQVPLVQEYLRVLQAAAMVDE